MIKGWMLPLLAAGITVPIVVGFLLAGPGLGLAVGALVATAIVIVAVRMRPYEEIEVEHREDERRRVLVVATEAIDEPPLAGRIADVAAGVAGNGGDAEVLVLAPAINTPVAHWASDLREARFSAQRRLALSIGTLAAAGVEARGQVGDSDTVQAVEDTLRGFAADEVVFVTDAGTGHDAAADVRDRLDLPVQELRLAG